MLFCVCLQSDGDSIHAVNIRICICGLCIRVGVCFVNKCVCVRCVHECTSLLGRHQDDATFVVSCITKSLSGVYFQQLGESDTENVTEIQQLSSTSRPMQPTSFPTASVGCILSSHKPQQPLYVQSVHVFVFVLINVQQSNKVHRQRHCTENISIQNQDQKRYRSY